MNSDTAESLASFPPKAGDKPIEIAFADFGGNVWSYDGKGIFKPGGLP